MDVRVCERVRGLLAAARESLSHLKHLHPAVTASRFIAQAEDALKMHGGHTADPARALTSIAQAALLLHATVPAVNPFNETGSDPKKLGSGPDIAPTLELLREAQTTLASINTLQRPDGE